MIKLKSLIEALDYREIKGKLIINTDEITDVPVEDIHPEQYPESEDAYISYAEDSDGEALNDDILDKLNYDDEYANWKYQQVMDYIDMHRGQDLR